VTLNRLQQNFTVAAPNRTRVTDITYLRTHEGWLDLAVVMDLLSGQIVGGSMGARMETELVLNALLMAAWRRRPTEAVTIHSDQGSQFSSGYNTATGGSVGTSISIQIAGTICPSHQAAAEL
jgi:putative transposase